MGTASNKAGGTRGLLTRLARDVRGNTLAIMAMAMIPLAGMVGGGIDISRMYILKTRLQHACDAGTLAGRRTMGAGTWSYDNYAARSEAEQFFDANFTQGSYGSSNRQRAFTENAGKVTGTASAVIPMTLMRIFGKTTDTITVTCDAEMRLPNTDVMFVLDTTGSMASAQPGDTVSKMSALKTAVKCFYEIVARLDTDANCTTGTPSGGTGNQVQIRFGFVPYAANVNVGKLLKPEWFADTWNYQTREAVYTTQNGSASWVQTSATVVDTKNITVTNVAQAYCTDEQAAASGYNPRDPSSGYNYSNGNTRRQYDQTITKVTNWTSNSGGTCYATQTKTRYIEDYKTSTTQVFSQWHYGQLPVNVALLKNGGGMNSTFLWPIGTNGANKSITWQGCIEERATVRATSYDPIPAGAKDLDIDLVPVAGDDSTKWGMALPELIHTRKALALKSDRAADFNLSDAYTTDDYKNTSVYSCPVESKKLQTWPDPNAFDDYVDSLAASGNTYHDIGLVWGARLMSAGDANGNGGLFASENKYTAQGGEIERNLIFMTDGEACTENYNYASHGIDWFDRRQTSTSTVPTDGCDTVGTLTQQVNKRTEGLCTAVKNKNITLWVIAFGSLSTTTETRLKNCATSGRYFKATNAAGLQQTFKTIADQISMLRLTS